MPKRGAELRLRLPDSRPMVSTCPQAGTRQAAGQTETPSSVAMCGRPRSKAGCFCADGASLEATSQSEHELQKAGRDWPRADRSCWLMDSLLPELPAALVLVPGPHSRHPRIRGAEMPPTASRPGQDPAPGPRVFTLFLLLEPVPRGTRHAFEPEVSHRRVTCPGECQVPPSSEPRAWTLFYGAGLSGAAADFIHQPGAFPTAMLNL